MGLTNVWLRTLGDELVRADQITAIDAHPTPALSGKPSHWLLDVVVPGQVGSGSRGDWGINPLHRTLIQTSHHPGDAPDVLAGLLAQLDAISAAGIITTTRDRQAHATEKGSEVRFQFVPFVAPSRSDHRDGERDDAEYL